MPDDIGVRVWRFASDGGVTYRTYKPSAADSEPGIWLALDAASLARLRERVISGLHQLWGLDGDYEGADEAVADAVLAALGLDPS